MLDIFRDLKDSQNITSDELDSAVAEALFSYDRSLPENFEIVETKNSIIMKSGNVFPTSKKGFLTKEEVCELVDGLTQG